MVLAPNAKLELVSDQLLLSRAGGVGPGRRSVSYASDLERVEWRSA
jgi:hypothetical protein